MTYNDSECHMVMQKIFQQLQPKKNSWKERYAHNIMENHEDEDED